MALQKIIILIFALTQVFVLISSQRSCNQDPNCYCLNDICQVCSKNDDCPNGYKCVKDRNNKDSVKYCTNNQGGGSDGCFPGDALVYVFNEGKKQMKELSIGDKVAVGEGENGLVYSDIYAFGHKDSDVLASFIRVETASKTLELTPGHFVPIEADGKWIYKRAEELKHGDTLSGNASIIDITTVEKLGLYNPFTLSGTVLVNDVLASVHSEWFLDKVFDLVGVSHLLPSVYQAILAPVRSLYGVLGKEMYTVLYGLVDDCVNVAEFGTKYGGAMAFMITIGGLVSTVAALKNK